MSISPSSKEYLPPLDPKALQDERFSDDFGTQVVSKKDAKKAAGRKKISNLFEKNKGPSSSSENK